MFAGFERTYLESPEPGWFALVTRWNHPPGAERIRFANNYHLWVEGKPLQRGVQCQLFCAGERVQEFVLLRDEADAPFGGGWQVEASLAEHAAAAARRNSLLESR
jgi:hypothetical protein